jgi:predicted AlkP superfamily pyrophosphatase or phosphodiesterase
VEKELQASAKLWDRELAKIDTTHSRNIAWKDLQWTQAAVHIVQEHRPNLLLFHLLSTDASNHSYGPEAPAVMSRTVTSINSSAVFSMGSKMLGSRTKQL